MNTKSHIFFIFLGQLIFLSIISSNLNADELTLAFDAEEIMLTDLKEVQIEQTNRLDLYLWKSRTKRMVYLEIKVEPKVSIFRQSKFNNLKTLRHNKTIRGLGDEAILFNSPAGFTRLIVLQDEKYIEMKLCHPYHPNRIKAIRKIAESVVNGTEPEREIVNLESKPEPVSFILPNYIIASN